MPEQFSFPFEEKNPKIPPIEIPVTEEATIPPKTSTMDQSTIDLPLEDASINEETRNTPPHENISQKQVLPLTEEERLSLIAELQDPLSVSFKQFKESDINGRLKIFDRILPAGQITYTEMFQALNLTQPEKKILSSFDSPKTTMNAITRRYESMLRIQQTPRIEQEQQRATFPHHFVRNTISQRPRGGNPMGGDAKKRAAGDTEE
jgi:hypothetical protein